jgi:uncharacterized protein (TIGR02246 family)
MKCAVAACCVCFAVALTVLSGQVNAEQEVLKLQKEYEAAIARRDASVHERLFADDYTYTPGNGDFLDKAGHIAFTKSGAVSVDSFRSEDVRARVYANTVVITGRWVFEGTRGGRAVGRQIRYLIVYVTRNGRWQIIAEQRTPVAQ